MSIEGIDDMLACVEAYMQALCLFTKLDSIDLGARVHMLGGYRELIVHERPAPLVALWRHFSSCRRNSESQDSPRV